MFNTTRFPYISLLYDKKMNKRYFGIIQNISKSYTSFYDILKLKQNNDLSKIISLSDIWWNSTNDIPLCLYYREKFDIFDYAKQHIPTNDISVVNGWEGISLKNLAEKRIKRKIISY